jgi:hypothetical protein
LIVPIDSNLSCEIKFPIYFNQNVFPWQSSTYFSLLTSLDTDTVPFPSFATTSISPFSDGSFPIHIFYLLISVWPYRFEIFESNAIMAPFSLLNEWKCQNTYRFTQTQNVNKQRANLLSGCCMGASLFLEAFPPTLEKKITT